jgi:hypothetical protein
MLGSGLLTASGTSDAWCVDTQACTPNQSDQRAFLLSGFVTTHHGPHSGPLPRDQHPSDLDPRRSGADQDQHRCSGRSNQALVQILHKFDQTVRIDQSNEACTAVQVDHPTPPSKEAITGGRRARKTAPCSEGKVPLSVSETAWNGDLP